MCLRSRINPELSILRARKCYKKLAARFTPEKTHYLVFILTVGYRCRIHFCFLEAINASSF